MGFRFRRSVSVAPGIRLNVTKNGLNSVSLGGPGASLNMGRGGTRTTVGLPGSGISYSSRTGSESSLGTGLAVAGMLVLIIAAIRGNRLARIALVALGVGLLILCVSSGSPRPNSGPSESAAISGITSTGVQWSTGAGSSPRSDNTSPSGSITGITSTGVQWSAKPAPDRAPAEQQPVSTPHVSLAPVQAAMAAPLAPATPLAAPVQSALSVEAVITTTGANVRAIPSINGKILRQLAVNTPLLVTRSEGSWANVRDEDSGEILGWVHRSILRAR